MTQCGLGNLEMEVHESMSRGYTAVLLPGTLEEDVLQ